MDVADLLSELLEENSCTFNKNKCLFNNHVVWKFRAVTATGNVMYVLLENGIINVQVNDDLWRTYNIENPSSLNKIVEALEVSLDL